MLSCRRSELRRTLMESRGDSRVSGERRQSLAVTEGLHSLRVRLKDLSELNSGQVLKWAWLSAHLH